MSSCLDKTTIKIIHKQLEMSDFECCILVVRSCFALPYKTRDCLDVPLIKNIGVKGATFQIQSISMIEGVPPHDSHYGDNKQVMVLTELKVYLGGNRRVGNMH